MHNKFNNSIQPNKVWSYYEVLEWMENNLVININASGSDLEVHFPCFPDGILGYMRQNNNKRHLQNQIIIFICTTHHGRHVNRINGNEVRISNRGYTIPLPTINMEGNKSIIKKNWRVLSPYSALYGNYVYEDFFSEFPERSTPLMAAYFLGDDGGGHNSYMVAIALADEGNMTANIWFSNVLRTDKVRENAISEIETEE